MNNEKLLSEIRNSTDKALELMLMVLKKEEYRKIVQDELDRRNKERKLTLKWVKLKDQ